MTSIPWPLSSSPGQRPQESAGRLINAYVEARGNKAGLLWRRAPGIKPWGTTTYSGPRGFVLVGSTLYGAMSGKLVRWSSSGGAATDVGNLAGTLKVFFAVNNKRPTPDQVVVTENGAFTFTTSAVSAFADLDLPFPNSVCFAGGYFFFGIGDGRIFASGLNDVTINPLHFATAESKPDQIINVIPFGKNLLVCGSSSIEVWGEPINSSGFPYSYINTIQRGLAGAHAIAGHQDGFGHGLMWVGDDNTVSELIGYEARPVSPPDLNRAIEDTANKSTLESCVYTSGGTAFWQLSSPTWTWVRDMTTGEWHERQSHLSTRSRISTTIAAYGNWLCGDTATGNVFEIDHATKSESGSPLRVRIESGPVSKFPHRTRIARADFLITTGVGIATGIDPIEVDPTLEISWSNNGGVDWVTPLQRKLGRQQEAEKRISIFNAGLSGPIGQRWRLDMSDPVDFGLMGGDQSEEVRYF